jgi:pimeloyl-ACP methyl ester carboxylesterase
LPAGYAVAATSYRDNGWTVKESIHDITALRTFFNGAVGRPDTALLVGLSLGSFVTATMAERGGGC